MVTRPIFTLCIFLTCVISAPCQQSDSIARKWIQDLDFAVTTLKENHANLYHDVSEEDFANQVISIRNAIPRLSEIEINFEFLKLFATIGDLHTSYRGQLGNKWLPIKVAMFSDGAYITTCIRGLNLTGAKILSVDGMEINEVMKRLGTVAPHDNDNGIRIYFPIFFPRPMLLKHLGIISSAEQVTLVIERQAKKETILVTSIDKSPDESNWLPLNFRTNAPLYRKNREKHYWSRYLKDDRIYYMKCNLIVSESDGAFSTFFSQTFDSIANSNATKLIFDLRNCLGGDDPEYRPMLAKLLYILEEKKLNNKDQFYVVTGTETTSAAQHLVNDIEYLTNATFIGEATSQRVHFFSDSRIFKLPNCRTDFRVSVGFLQNYVPSPFERRTTKEPDVEVGLRYTDFINGVDPVVLYIKTH